ncbi:MAG: type II secretion system protein [Armatimonadota bacterium]
MVNKRTRAGFTLVELLVVISITIILMGLIFAPIVQTFNMTRQANAMVMAQNTARTTLEQVSREVSQAMFVYDNANSPINFPVQQPDGTTEKIKALYGKIDIVLPKLVMHCNNPDHDESQPRDYERGDDAWPECPVCKSTDIEARPKEPLVADGKIVRYFVGLLNNDPNADLTVFPAENYRDWPETGSPLNGFILYRAEVDPYDKNLFKFDNDGKPILDDPDFFYSTEIPEDGNGKPFWENWKAVSKPVGPQTDTDLVLLRMNDANDRVVTVVPSVRFQPAQMTDDSFKPAYVTDEGTESPASIPSVFRASYGAWASSVGNSNLEMYSVSLNRYNSESDANDIWYRTARQGDDNHLVINRYDSAGNPTFVFDITDYETNGVFPTDSPEVAFVVDPVKGEVRFDFPDSDVIHQDDIIAMNQRVALNSNASNGSPARMYRLTMFDELSSTSEFKPRIVPGSEVVMGPDMTSGLQPEDIKMVRYERVPFNLGDPRRNQYKIDYGMSDSSNADNSVGWIVFSPAYDDVIPETMSSGESRFEISYKFQCNRDGDVVIGNYATKTLMQITMGIRYYDRNSGKVHPVELTNKVRIRNLMR